MKHQAEDLSGRRYGTQTVAWPVGRRLCGKTKRVVYLCFCDCGKSSLILRDNLWTTKSCGCVPRIAPHGHMRGRKPSPEYVSYKGAKQRCQDKNHDNYPAYGGSGIEFRFRSFEDFLAVLGPRPEGTTCDRWPNPAGHYEKGNVRWANSKQQRHNRRTK
jgi:hypothetical protein